MKKFGFLRHNKKIKIEGTDLPKIVNKCIRNDIMLRDLKYKDPLESTVSLKHEDYSKLTKLAGHSYKVTVINEHGMIPLVKTMKTNIATIIGAFLVGALIFYQSLFVAEIRVDGYSGIPETELRQTLTEAGLYEGVKKPEDYSEIKAVLYEEHPEITWVSIYEDGRLIKVNIAEAGDGKAAQKEDKTPVNIVASQSGMIEKIIPLQGNAKVKKGDYVNKGDVLISGRYKYQSSDYSKGDGFFTMYSHAKGHVYAKVPRQLVLYMEKAERLKIPTGRKLPGFYIKIGDMEFDTAGAFCRYETSVRHENMIIDAVRPLPVSIGFVTIEEVELAEKRRDKAHLDKVVNAAVRQYQRDEMDEGEEIVSRIIEYSDTENLIEADVFLEVTEDIGEERLIKVKKGKKEEKTEKDT